MEARATCRTGMGRNWEDMGYDKVELEKGQRWVR